MKEKIFILAILVFAFQAKAADVFCEAWYQDPGQKLQKLRLPVAEATEKNLIFSGTLNAYDFKVDWNRELTTFYVFIESAGSPILFTTARVPTENHPENFTDLHIPNGPRLSVNCESP